MIPSERLAQVREILERAGLQEQTVSALREAFTDLHFTYCMDEDVGTEEPVIQAKGFNLYLVDGRGHCMRFTTDRKKATGILLAEVEEC